MSIRIAADRDESKDSAPQGDSAEEQDHVRAKSVGSRRAWPVFAMHAMFLAGVVLLAWTIGSRHAEKYDGQYYQHEMAPAVMEACGRGFRQPEVYGPALKNFLSQATDKISCEQLAPDQVLREPEAFARGHRYLFGLISLAWSFTGPDWAVVEALSVAFYVAAAAACYLMFAMVTPPLIAFIGTAILAASIANIGLFLNFRDYAKVPFIYLGSAVVLHILFKARSPKDVIISSLIAGAIFGVGAGFRMDLLAYIIIGAASLVLAAHHGFFRSPKVNIVAATAFLIAAGLGAAPTMLVAGSEGATFHVVILGLSDIFTHNMRLAVGDYSWIPLYFDQYVGVLLSSYGGAEQFYSIHSREYSSLAFSYYRDLVSIFPADLYGRMLAAIHNGLNTFPNGFVGDEGYRQQIVALATIARDAWVGELSLVAIFFAVVRRDVFKGTAVLLLCLFLFSLPFLQYDVRHYGHNMAFSLLLFLVCLTGAYNHLRRSICDGTLTCNGAGSSSRLYAAFFVLATGSAIFAPLLVLTPYQKKAVQDLWAAYGALDYKPLASDVRTLHATEAAWQTYIVRITVRPSDCGNEVGTLAPMYNGFNSYAFTHGVAVRLNVQKEFKIFIPVFVSSERLKDYANFTGVWLSDSLRGCTTVAYSRLPPGMVAVLGSSSSAVEPIDLFGAAVLPANPDKPHSADASRLPSAGEENPRYEKVFMNNRSYVAEGGAVSEEAFVASLSLEDCCRYVFQSRDISFEGDTFITLSGILEKGILQIGLQSNGQWYTQTLVRDTGPFSVSLPLPSGDASVVLAPVLLGDLKFSVFDVYTH